VCLTGSCPGDSIVFSHTADAHIPTFDLGDLRHPPTPLLPVYPHCASFSTGKRSGCSITDSSGEVQVKSSDKESVSPEGMWYTVDGCGEETKGACAYVSLPERAVINHLCQRNL
jgi:hypothetical protein